MTRKITISAFGVSPSLEKEAALESEAKTVRAGLTACLERGFANAVVVCDCERGRQRRWVEGIIHDTRVLASHLQTLVFDSLAWLLSSKVQ
ncbi:hypothetical protein C1H46_040022 [Malus baccata]|uniref:Uncharacterized protein n=1 Tax=Malus baccata TaxID=106549 RepID=A0A540KJP5_MALBA|nr:hypothetical protein C1H46_040022 [Malus baccata]